MVLTNIDVLGPDVRLTIQKNKFFRSNFGGFSTLVILGIFLFAFFGFGEDLFHRKKPSVTFNRVINNELLLYNLTDDNFLLTINDQVSGGSIPDFDRRFFIYYDYFSIVPGGTSKFNMKVPMQNCTEVTLNYRTFSLLWAGSSMLRS